MRLPKRGRKHRKSLPGKSGFSVSPQTDLSCIFDQLRKYLAAQPIIFTIPDFPMLRRLLPLLWMALLSSTVFAQKYLDMIDAGTYTLAEIQQEAKVYFDARGRGRGTGFKQFKRWEYVAQQELDDKGVKIPNFELSQRARVYRASEK